MLDKKHTTTLHFAEKSIEFTADMKPLVMGILNITPDSFSDGGRLYSVEKAVLQADIFIKNGATFLDIGGESTRPKGKAYGEGASVVTVKEEIERVVPVIHAIRKAFPEIIISVDTYKPQTAKAALDVGANFLNDVTGLRFGTEMAVLANEFGVPLCLMHSVGKIGEMPHLLDSDDIVQTVKNGLAESVAAAKSVGLTQLILDVGFGFGKNPQDNLKLLKHQSAFLAFGYPLLIGISRKSTIGGYLGTFESPKPINERLFGSLGATAVALQQGAKIVRTHDVKETVEFINLLHETQMA
jgi:dihydropteroate synthase